jgi:phospholipase C
VLATLNAIFGLKNFLTLRDKSANSFEGLFNELVQPRNDAPATLPRAPLPQITVPAGDPRHPANQPLDRDQRDLVMKVFHLTQRSQPKSLTAASLPMTQGEAHDFVQQSYRKHFGPPGKPGIRHKPATHG